MNKIYKILICLFFFLITDLSLNAQGIVTKDSCTVPTIITPNDDGLNDELRIPCLSDDNPDSELLVFNEGGDRVYYAKPYRNDWKGTYKQHNLPDGTYYYLFRPHLTVDFSKGYVSIFR
jgi:gliding motility-associated-like protein